MALKDVIIATQADLRDNPEHANATFAADSRQVDGLRSETKIRQFSLTIDEPPNLGGTDTGPNPVELVLAALATCQEITYRAYATALGIPLESVSVKLEGALDLRGFFAVKDGVRAGFNDVRGTVQLKSSAPEAELAKLKEVVDAHSGARYPARPGAGKSQARNPARGPRGLGDDPEEHALGLIRESERRRLENPRSFVHADRSLEHLTCPPSSATRAPTNSGHLPRAE
jgi:putative redox protein